MRTGNRHSLWLLAFVALFTGCRVAPNAAEPDRERAAGGEIEHEQSLVPVDTMAPPGGFDVSALQTRYTKDIPGEGRLYVTFLTSAGKLQCLLHEEEAPRTVDNFVGLARGLKTWTDPASKEPVKRPFYDGLSFHRVVPNVLIQTGDPTNSGVGHPGFTIDDEFGAGLEHDSAGVMAMAQSRPNGSGSQFYITDSPTPQFDGRYPIFGHCEDLDVIHKIAAAALTEGTVDRPLDPIRIESLSFERR